VIVLFDHGIPRGLGNHLPGHTVTLAIEKGWDRLSNGKFLSAAEAAFLKRSNHRPRLLPPKHRHV
jgi:hypothetical protein